MKISAPAQCASTSQSSRRLAQACGGRRPGPVRFQRQPGSDHGDDARRPDALLGADIGEVGQRHRESRSAPVRAG